MPTVNLNVESQIASEITRATLITTVGTSSLKRKHYHITDAVNNTKKIAVFYRTDSAVTFWGYDVNNGQTGRYFLIQDLFIPIVEAQGAVLTYINLAAFPGTGTINTVYIAQDTGTGYTWNGSAYVALSGGTVFAVNFAALPVTGSANTLYITTDNGNSYLWNGSSYVQTSSGVPVTAVESVTGYSVDNTDPVNPIVKAIPTAGTDVAEPVTGGVQLSGGFFFYDDGSCYNLFSADIGGDVGFINNDTVNSTLVSLLASSGQSLINTSNFVGYKGIEYAADYSANFVLRSLIDQEVLKKRFWTKAGAPTTSDDSTQGYIVGSIIFDTTNSILYRCTNNSTGAAVWTTNFQQLRNDVYINLGGGTIPAGATQYAPIGSQAAFNSDETTRYTPQPEDAVVFKFKVYIRTAQPGTGSAVANLRANGSNISTITIPAGSAAGVYGSNTVVAVVENDLLTVGVTNNASGASAQFTSATLAMYN